MVTKDVARARLEERRRQVRLGQLDMIGNKIPTLSEFSQEYIKHIRDIKGNRSWMSALQRFSLNPGPTQNLSIQYYRIVTTIAVWIYFTGTSDNSRRKHSCYTHKK